jgi:hypothetical protein
MIGRKAQYHYYNKQIMIPKTAGKEEFVRSPGTKFNPGLSVAMNLLLLEYLISVEHLMPLKSYIYIYNLLLLLFKKILCDLYSLAVKDHQIYLFIYFVMPSIFHWAAHHNTKVVKDIKSFSFGKNKPMLPYFRQ